MLRVSLITLSAIAAAIIAVCANAQGFRFSNEDPADKADKAQEAERQAKVQSQLTTPCLDKIRNQKIMVLIG
jgi:hypothetical protein